MSATRGDGDQSPPRSEHDIVTIETTAGPVEFHSPVPWSETVSPEDLEASLTQHPHLPLHERDDVIRIRIRDQWRYPTFQFNTARTTVHPVVAELNRHLGARDDPWGCLFWWTTPDGGLGSLSALDHLERGTLSPSLVKYLMLSDGVGMGGEIRLAERQGDFPPPVHTLPVGVTSEMILDELRGDH